MTQETSFALLCLCTPMKEGSSSFLWLLASQFCETCSFCVCCINCRLRSCCRLEARAPPNNRIYSNAFQGSRETASAAPYNFMQDKVCASHVAFVLLCLNTIVIANSIFYSGAFALSASLLLGMLVHLFLLLVSFIYLGKEVMPSCVANSK